MAWSQAARDAAAQARQASAHGQGVDKVGRHVVPAPGEINSNGTPFQEGYFAAVDGSYNNENPHSLGTAENYDWAAGHATAIQKGEAQPAVQRSGGYNRDSIDKAIDNASRYQGKVSGRERSMIHALLKGRH